MKFVSMNALRQYSWIYIYIYIHTYTLFYFILFLGVGSLSRLHTQTTSTQDATNQKCCEKLKCTCGEDARGFVCRVHLDFQYMNFYYNTIETLNQGSPI